MALSNSISVRFRKEDRERLARAAQRSGLSAADLVRFATQNYLLEIEKTGKIQLELRAMPSTSYRGRQGG